MNNTMKSFSSLSELSEYEFCNEQTSSSKTESPMMIKSKFSNKISDAISYSNLSKKIENNTFCCICKKNFFTETIYDVKNFINKKKLKNFCDKCKDIYHDF